jgi:hypothetical protein
MSDILKKLAILVDKEVLKVGQKQSKKIVLSYTNPNDEESSKVKKMGHFADALEKETIDKIKSLKRGDKFTIGITKQDNGYFRLESVEDESAAPPPKKRNPGGWQGNKGGSYDNSGMAIGGAWTTALKLLEIQGAKKVDLNDVKELAWEMAIIKEQQVEELKAYKKSMNNANPKDPEVKSDKSDDQADEEKDDLLDGLEDLDELDDDLGDL